ncbi:hypothetical protein QQL38_22205 [Pseudomonas syringae]|nr:MULTISPECIES: hypothetical protein [Pseudomonas syringae group]MCL6308248.1 hypothetical protein [Pseudomonas syringae]
MYPRFVGVDNLLPSAWPMKFTLAQAMCSQPDANFIVHQHFHALKMR